MREILTASQMRACDTYTSEYFGIDPAVLMERAALTTFISICNCGKMYEDSRTLIVCGTGNNGADGLALARILFEGEYAADFCIPFDNGKHSVLFDKQKSTLEKYGITPVSKEDIKDDYDIIVDALFGIGLSRDLSEETVDLIDKLNSYNSFRVALDIPSGINADTGEVMGGAFRADLTVTFGFAKRGQILFPARDYVGELLIANIGITEKSLDSLSDTDSGSFCFVIEKEDVVRDLPVRPDDGNKGTFGKVLVFAGSSKISGACVLASLSALKSGAGMVKVITSGVNVDILKKTVPEVMVTDTSDFESIKTDISWSDIILAGPGIGTDKESASLLRFLLENGNEKPFVLDADALNIIAGEEGEAGKSLSEMIARRQGITIFTPHMGEFSRLAKKDIKELKADIAKAAAEYAKEAGVILVAKDAVTCVTDGKRTVFVSSGNNGMATAGSGDVLAGIIAAYAAKSGSPLSAVQNAVYVHGMAGSACLESMAEDSVTAGDIIVSLQRVIKEIRDEQKGENV